MAIHTTITIDGRSLELAPTSKKITVSAPKNGTGSATDRLYHNTDNDVLNDT